MWLLQMQLKYLPFALASLIASLSWSGGCQSPSWEFPVSLRHKRASVLVRPQAAGGKAAPTVPHQGWLQVLLHNLTLILTGCLKALSLLLTS